MRASYLNFIQVAQSYTFEQHKVVFRVFVHCFGCLLYLLNEKKVADSHTAVEAIKIKRSLQQ